MDEIELLKKELNLTTIKAEQYSTGGCISSGNVYVTGRGKIFVKSNAKPNAKLMFDGEHAGLEEISDTKTVRVPKPMKVITHERGTMFVMEYLDLKPLRKFAKELGSQLADLHLSNQKLEQEQEKQQSYVGEATSLPKEPVTQFGFHVPTCCGYLPMVNDWCDEWIQFFATNRLKHQLDLVQKNYHDQEARRLWPEIERNLPKLFPKSLTIKPALLHGDLWGGNVDELESEPCIYDPACFYGHSEYELAIAHMFGGISTVFFQEYHKKIPKSEGFDKRVKAYQLFHYLNHWNHFGGGYRGSSLSVMKNLAKM